MISITRFCSQHKMAAISLATCLLELLIVWGVVIIVQLSGQQLALLRLASGAWVCGGLVSIICAIAALIIETRRGIGALSLAVAIVMFIVCGLPMMV